MKKWNWIKIGKYASLTSLLIDLMFLLFYIFRGTWDSPTFQKCLSSWFLYELFVSYEKNKVLRDYIKEGGVKEKIKSDKRFVRESEYNSLFGEGEFFGDGDERPAYEKIKSISDLQNAIDKNADSLELGASTSSDKTHEMYSDYASVFRGFSKELSRLSRKHNNNQQ